MTKRNHSKDGGASWQHVEKFGGSQPSQCRFGSFADATTGWIATPTKIGETVDSGNNWKKESIVSPCSVNGLCKSRHALYFDAEL